MAGSGEGAVIACETVEAWSEQIKAANESKKLVVIDFTATWCPPCRFIAPIFVELAKKFLNVVFFKIDVDKLKTVAEEYQVEAMPTFVFLKEGVILERIVGAKKDDILVTLKKHGGVESA